MEITSCSLEPFFVLMNLVLFAVPCYTFNRKDAWKVSLSIVFNLAEKRYGFDGMRWNSFISCTDIKKICSKILTFSPLTLFFILVGSTTFLIVLLNKYSHIEHLLVNSILWVFVTFLLSIFSPWALKFLLLSMMKKPKC